MIINAVTGRPLSNPPTETELRAVALLGALDDGGDLLWAGNARSMFRPASNGEPADNPPCLGQPGGNAQEHG